MNDLPAKFLQNRRRLARRAIAAAAALIALSGFAAGCKEGSGKGEDGHFAAGRQLSAEAILSHYGPSVADLECHVVTGGGMFSAGEHLATRSCAVALVQSGSRLLLLCPQGEGQLISRQGAGYRIWLDGKDLPSATLAGVYLANTDAALLLAQSGGGNFTMDLATQTATAIGAELTVIYYDQTGYKQSCPAVVESTGATNAAHVSNLLVKLPANVKLPNGVAFANLGGGLAGIVTSSQMGTAEIIPATQLLRPDYWQYAGDRYEIQKMLGRIKKR